MDMQEAIKQGISLNTGIIKRGGGSKISISIINSEKNGKRMIFSKKLLEELGNPLEIQFVLSTTESCLFIGENLLPDENKYAFTKEGFNVLYCGAIIPKIVTTFGLDYSNGKTSLTFNNIEIEEMGGSPVAIVKFD